MHNIQINSFIFKRVKIAAKQLKNSHPELSHSQRLDLSAQTVVNKRHFHEVKQLHDKYLKIIEFPNNDASTNRTYTCQFCHMLFCPDLDEDIKDHETHHKEREKAEFYLQYSPLSFSDREKLKSEAYNTLNGDGSENKQLTASLNLLKAYYDRSLDSSIFNCNWKEHPNLEQYIATYEFNDIFPKNIIKILRKKYSAR
jgi:hypothetical protein